MPSTETVPALRRADRPTALAVVLARALELVSRDAPRGRESVLAQLVEVDAVLRGAVLRIVRCPVYGEPEPGRGGAPSLERLAPDLLVDAFRGAAPDRRRPTPAVVEARCRTWLHGIAVGAAARWLSNQGGHDEPDEAYLAGLAHALCHGIEHSDALFPGAPLRALAELRLGPRVETVVRRSRWFATGSLDDAQDPDDGSGAVATVYDDATRSLFAVVARADRIADALGFGACGSHRSADPSGDDADAAVAEAIGLEIAHAATLLGIDARPHAEIVKQLVAREQEALAAPRESAWSRAFASVRLVRLGVAHDEMHALRVLPTIQEIVDQGAHLLHRGLPFDRVIVVEREHGHPEAARVRAVACRTGLGRQGPVVRVELPVPAAGTLARAFDGGSAQRSDDDDAQVLAFLGSPCFAVAPLRAGSASVGAVLADHFVTRRDVTDEEVAALGISASALGLVLENAALVGEGRTLRALAEMDALTGINNRRNILEILRREIDRARRYGKPLSVALLDVDHFKSWNDDHGHQVGDAVLQSVAQLVSSLSREIDACGRYGGEEFLVVLPETTAEQAVHFADRIRVAVEGLGADLAGRYSPAALSVSVGVTQLRARGDDADRMIRRADAALYAAKSDGRNAVRVEVRNPGETTSQVVRATST